MRKTREKLEIPGNISCKEEKIKDRNCMDLTEAEDIKKIS